MKVKKWLPCSMWDFQGIEEWLNEQASAGYALVDWPSFFDIGRIPFQPDPSAPGSRYRLEPVDNRVDWKEHNELYKQMGWQYVTQIHQLYTVYRCDDPQAPELYTDPESLALTLKKMVRRQWRLLILVPLWIAFLLRDLIYQLFTAPATVPMRVILEADVLLPLCLVLLVAVGIEVFSAVRRLYLIRHLYRQLSQGIIPKAAKRRYQTPCVLLLSVTVFSLSLFWVVQTISNSYNSQWLEGTEEWNFPHVTLEEILPTGASLRQYSPQEMLFSDETQQSWLAPEQYRVAQGGMVTLPDGSQMESRLYLNYFRTRSPSLAQVVFQGSVEERWQELEEYQKNWEKNTSGLYADYPTAFTFVTRENMDFPGFDQLVQITYQFSDRTTPNLFYVGLVGTQVFTFTCSGAADETTALSLLVQRLTSAL
ncbi:MAG: DUF2812 domain-containing protein [Lawsonibacter sp.]|jgi:hypothetical protein